MNWWYHNITQTNKRTQVHNQTQRWTYTIKDTPSIFLSCYLSIFLSLYNLSIYLIIYISFYLSIHLSIYRIIYISFYLYQSIHPSIYISIFLSTYLYLPGYVGGLVYGCVPVPGALRPPQQDHVLAPQVDLDRVVTPSGFIDRLIDRWIDR